jgi:DNA mismatch endonuclease, patch repair protein
MGAQFLEKLLKETLEHGIFTNVSTVRSRAMAAVRSRGNRTTELRVRLALVRAGISGWVMHPENVVGRPDIYFPREKVAVFVDGCFWHGCPRCGHVPETNSAYWRLKIQRNKDRRRRVRGALRKQRIRLLRIWEHDCLESGFISALKGVLRA